MELSHKRSLIWPQSILIATKQVAIRGDLQSLSLRFFFLFQLSFEKVGKRNIYLPVIHAVAPSPQSH